MEVMALLLPAVLAICGDALPEEDPREDIVTVPPGGYAWAVFDDDSTCDFHVVHVFAPGPWMVGVEDLPEFVPAVLDSCPGWLRRPLLSRFGDLLYGDFHAEKAVVPVPAVLSDGEEALVVAAPDGSIQEVLACDGWRRLGKEYPVRKRSVPIDVTGDALPDSVYFVDETMILLSGDKPVLSSGGWRLPPLSGITLMDVEGDGLADLVLGTDTGEILICRNRGTSVTPCFPPFSSSSAVAFPMRPGAFCSPEIVNRGDSLRLMAGTGSQGLKLYAGTVSEKPISVSWSDSVVTVTRGVPENVSPVAVDGRILCVGRDGTVYVYGGKAGIMEPSGLPGVPGTYPQLCEAFINDDGLPDLVAGTFEGDVYFLPGEYGGFAGEWIRLEGLPSMPSCSPAPWNGGLVFGLADGDFRYFERYDGKSWRDVTEESPFEHLYVNGFASPVFSDLDEDGTPELVAGDGEGGLTLFRLHDDCAPRPVFLEESSWRFLPGGAAGNPEDYYSRYFRPYSVLRVPDGREVLRGYCEEISATLPRLRDEVAFCIAYTPTEVLEEMFDRGDDDLFRLNAEILRNMADMLPYVRLRDSAGVSWCELKTDAGRLAVDPMDYYRFVVHPRVLFETPAGVNIDYWKAPRDTSLSMEEWLNFEPEDLYGSSSRHVFWREYIPSDTSGRKSLSADMSVAETYEDAILRLCNFQSYSQPEGMMSFGYSTNDLQPMVIYAKAYGSCGEQSILQVALCRTFLIPAFVVGCRGEDHQWAHCFDPGGNGWMHWDMNYGVEGIGGIWVSGEGINHSGKTISSVTAFGPDNTVWPVTKNAKADPGSGYMPGDSGYTATATVRVLVTDPCGIPVEGAMVLARSHWEGNNSVSQFQYTDLNGKCRFELGWEPLGGYTFDVVTPFGTAGSRNVAFDEGDRVLLKYVVPCTVPVPQAIELPPEAAGGSMLKADFYPVSYFSGSLYSMENDEDAGVSSGGWTGWSEYFFPGNTVYMDSHNFQRYVSGLDCRAVTEPFDPPEGDTCYMVLDNRNGMFTWLEYDVRPRCFFDDISAGVPTWLEGDAGTRIPVSACRPGPPFFGDPVSGCAGFVRDAIVRQDDPGDPLSSGLVVGPFAVSPQERNPVVEIDGEGEGLDLDLFIFHDSDGDLLVDGMEELEASSTSPTPSERVILPYSGSSDAFWIYVHGWNVPGDSAEVRISTSFEPRPFPVHSLVPSGYVRKMPGNLRFGVSAGEEDERVFVVVDGDTLSSAASGVDSLEVTLPPGFSGGDVRVVFEDESGNRETLEWNLRLDDVSPDVPVLDIEVDVLRMQAYVEVRTGDEDSGVERVTLSAGKGPEMIMTGTDSLWRGTVDLQPMKSGAVVVKAVVTDFAGNRSESTAVMEVPPRPPVIFRNPYPSGTTYHHRPVIQVSVDAIPGIDPGSAVAVLRDEAGTRCGMLEPRVVGDGYIQFRPDESLEAGKFRVEVLFPGSVPVFTWEFEVGVMKSAEEKE